jgi:tRNA-Thr(GGU) m(6)t(6)A37 methyltransferase TsaA
MEYPLIPIATAQSCFLDCAATPRQPGLTPDTHIRLKFDKRLGPDSFDGLMAHSHVWLIYVFHKNTNSDRTLAQLPKGKTFPAKIKPPRRRGAAQPKLGVLGTRTPHRPNPIGLSLGVLRDLDRNSRTLTVAGTDLVDGTPILDIKPYVPCYDSRPLSAGLVAPAWLADAAPAVCPQV